ncbi:ribbon-helix-helix protein, CopG family [Pygmaiobacter massiliensis]|uniref:ribbon-helix-helix protein, CopG family n=1 Tax=Pygmaiobacter massiliensis TaxID=1917873 RepID=UPI002A83620A|nr:ribbon-helix-helix protein, CopG family [Pygmaiobacter massiliensis]MDY4785554.1 ribbon-helix-helix protein, CopG family [Pygmaiobacter massiliensis]
MPSKIVRMDDELAEDLQKLAQEKNTSENDIFNRALRFYRDYCYMQDKATVINQDVLNVARSMANVAEKNINYKTNKYLSELAVQQAMLNMIIGNSLDFSEQDLQVFRLKALDTIKETPRVLRLDEVHDG